MLGNLDAIDRNHRVLTGVAPEPEVLVESEVVVVPPPDVPTESWLKADIQKWLDDRYIPYDTQDTKAELLARVELPQEN